MPNPRAGIFAPVLSMCWVARVETEREKGRLQRAACARGIYIEKRDIFVVMKAMVYMIANLDSF